MTSAWRPWESLLAVKIWPPAVLTASAVTGPARGRITESGAPEAASQTRTVPSSLPGHDRATIGGELDVWSPSACAPCSTAT